MGALAVAAPLRPAAPIPQHVPPDHMTTQLFWSPVGHWVFLRPNKTLWGQGEAQSSLAQSLCLSPASAVIRSWPDHLALGHVQSLAPLPGPSVWFQIPGGLGVSVSKRCLVLPPHLSPPGPPVSLTIMSHSHTQLQVVPQVTQGTHWILPEVLSPPSHPCLPLGEPKLCGGWNPCMKPEPPQNCSGKSMCLHQDMRHTVSWGPVRDCGATWALGAGIAPACWCCQGVGRSGVNAGGASALRHPGFLANPSSPWPVSSFAWPAMAAIPWCSEGK